MCRLLFMRPPFERKKVEDLMTFLEGAAGGDGNGVAILYDGHVKTLKGVKLRVQDIVAEVMKAQRPFIFHTRKQSVGPVSDQLCQPFVIDNRTVLAHNGTLFNWKDLAEKMLVNRHLDRMPLVCSDSLIAAHALHKWGPGFIANVVTSGAWLVASVKPKLEVFGILRTGVLHMDTDGVVASEFPKDWPIDEADHKNDTVVSLWPEYKVIQGGQVEVKKKPTPANSAVVVKEVTSTRTTYGIRSGVCVQCNGASWEHVPKVTPRVLRAGCKEFVSGVVH